MQLVRNEEGYYYSEQTYEEILGRLLDKVDNRYDKRESSVIYNAVAPVALELAIFYTELELNLEETFAETASRDFLIKRVAERGIEPYPAEAAKVKAEILPESIEVPIGSRFNFEEINYQVSENLGGGQYVLDCEEPGEVGNVAVGRLTPIDAISSLASAQIVEVLVPGTDEEDTESIRARYFDTFDSEAFGGNVLDYQQKVNSIAGVGSAKITPAWQGGGTVLVSVLDNQFLPASTTLVKRVQEEIDPGTEGKGLGLAPIGHKVTVRTAEKVAVKVNVRLVLYDTYQVGSVQPEVVAEIEAYLAELRSNWAKQSFTVVRLAQLETRILNVPGVLDIVQVTLNGREDNLELKELELPVLGEVKVHA